MKRPRLSILITVFLVALTLAAFWRVLGCGFVDYDDDVYVTANRWVQSGLTLKSAAWALTARYEATWQPLVWLSYMADYEVYGLRAAGFHLTNLLLHVANVLLLFLVLRRMTGSAWRSAFVAALFAVHPLRVESVAWIAERKDVLSALFWMLSMGAYTLYGERPGWKRYIPVFVFMALGLMAKPTLVTLPFLLLLLDYWPLGRIGKGFGLGRLIVEKVPLLCLSALSVAVTSAAQVGSRGLETVDRLPMGVRLANAAVSYVAYLVKMVWPSKLAVLYPHPYGSIPVWQVVGSAVVLVILTVLAVRASRARPYLAVGWLWYLGTMLPMIGIVQTGMHGMADRFTYVPLIGVFVAVTWGVAEWGSGRMDREASRRSGLFHPLVLCLSAAVILACAAATRHQIGYWTDSIALFGRAVAVTRGNYICEQNLGLALNKRGRFAEAIPHFRRSIRIAGRAKPYDGLGVALVQVDRLPEAVRCFEKALDLDPSSASTHANLGFASLDLGRPDAALRHFGEAVKLDPGTSAWRFGLGLAYGGMGNADRAAGHFREAVRLDPKNSAAHHQLALIALSRGDTDEAIGRFEAAVAAGPDPVAHYTLGGIYAQREDLDRAIGHYRAAVEIAPAYGNAHRNLAVALYFRKDYAGAWKEIRLARRSGAVIDPEFIKALSAEMPEPR